MRTLFTLTSVCCLIALHAQQQVRITRWDAIRADNALIKGRAAKAALQATGMPEEQQALVLSNSTPELLPASLRNDSARQANAPYLANYAAYRVFSFHEDTVPFTVVMLPAKDNIHMPEDLRPTADLFIAVVDSGLADAAPARQRPEISRGPRWKDLPQATILTPADVYATYDLGADAVARQALADAGMSVPEIEAVAFRSHERNWPDGIDSFEERTKLISSFARYKAYVGATWDDKVVLIVPVEKNKRMPKLMRPYVDIYLVYAKSAVAVKSKRRK
ncbi:MAG: hypothetical protein IT228_05735 [Flavobacteriales bacterium]|nr:hypothetical protein [Flavobacteriales bacterium]MCC6576825.1 hypothetical protein [Flavobacteriales bacterium]NUQ14047.1 hypothetical protein [Flavobacteriales bacterium]